MGRKKNHKFRASLVYTAMLGYRVRPCFNSKTKNKKKKKKPLLSSSTLKPGERPPQEGLFASAYIVKYLERNVDAGPRNKVQIFGRTLPNSGEKGSEVRDFLPDA